MSQKRALRFDLRAIAAIVGVCALLFGSLSVGARAQAHGALSHDASLTGGAIAFDAMGCRHIANANSDSSKPRSPAHSAHCPDCCLAAQAASAVLPARPPSATLPSPDAALRVVYRPLSTSEPASAASRSVNGARAPPLFS
jgi:hypothetical protein